MVLRICLFFLVLSATLNVNGQSALPQPLTLYADTAPYFTVPDSQLIYLVDKSGTLGFGDAINAVSQGRFKPWSDSLNKTLIKGQGERIWFYYRVTNQTGSAFQTGIDCYTSLSEYHIIHQDGRRDSLVTGNLAPWDRKKGMRYLNVVTFTLQPSETAAILERGQFSTPQLAGRYKARLVEPNRYAFEKWNYLENQMVSRSEAETSFFSGIMLMMAIIYFVFYSLVREKVFLFFGLMLFFFSTDGVFLADLIRHYPGLQPVYQAFGMLGFFFLFQFTRHYLRVYDHLPYWNRVLQVLAWLFIVVTLASAWLSRGTSNVVIIATVLLNFLALAITFFLTRKQMQQEKRFLLYALAPLLIFLPAFMIFLLFLSTLGKQQAANWTSLGLVLNRYFSIFLGLIFMWMILSFSRLLFRRFIEQRQRISDQEKEKEKILLEKEMERARLVEKQKTELEHQVAARTAELKHSLEELKATQSQLIQSEKMASLGEMTAGIAHEIQNPLNFVNNFAEVNAELTREIRQELEGLVTDPVKRKELEDLLGDIEQNQEKIRLHGKRADSIVRNMLQHSRSGSSLKESTDLNALVEEFVRLSFHGMRARNKSFNAQVELKLDPMVGKVDLLPQEFGRVVLNLANNAFYAVNEKGKEGNPGYAPVVTVTTKAAFSTGKPGSSLSNPSPTHQAPSTVILEIADNGNGIPQDVKNKVFQPFFTTKPTGEGTGLGLSISYDIIVKGHGGKMWVESTKGEGARFSVEIPA